MSNEKKQKADTEVEVEMEEVSISIVYKNKIYSSYEELENDTGIFLHVEDDYLIKHLEHNKYLKIPDEVTKKNKDNQICIFYDE